MKAVAQCTPLEIEEGVHLTTWGGRESFTCITCHFATLDKEEVMEHHYNVHILRPQLIENAKRNNGEVDLAALNVPDVPLFDGDGNLITNRKREKHA